MIPSEIIKSAGLSYDWYLEEAKSIVRELEQGKEKAISIGYLSEKIKNVKSLMTDLNDEIKRQKSIKKLNEHKKLTGEN